MYTIIVPFYKGKPFLDNFFHQVLSQTLSFEKLIFINDGDKSITQKEILKFSNKIHYIDNKINKGVNFSVLNSLKLVETPFVKIMSIDDIFDKNHAHNALSILQRDSQIAMSFTNPGHFILSNGKYQKYDFNLSKKNKIFFPEEFKIIFKNKTIKIFSNTVFFRTTILKKFLFCFDEIYSKYADQILNTLIALNYKTVFLPKHDSFWTIHESQNNKNFQADIIKILDHLKLNKPFYYRQLLEYDFFYDLNLIDLIKIYLKESNFINLNLLLKFVKFYSWKKLKAIVPTKIKKLIIYFLN